MCAHQLGQGSRFWFLFSPPFLESSDPVCQSNNAHSTIHASHTNTVILLVEDSVINREIFSAILCEDDFQIIMAENGREAVILVQQVEEHKYF